MGIKRAKVYYAFEDNINFDLYDGLHHFHNSDKEETLRILYNLRTRAYKAWKAWANDWDWKRDDDKYVAETPEQGEEKRAAEIKRCKKAFYKIDRWVERVENGPDSQWWKLDQYTMELYAVNPIKKTW